MASTVDHAVNCRADRRYGVTLDAVVHAYRMTPVSARLIDISGGGAMLMCEGDPPMRGDEVLLSVDRLELVATVAWAKKHAFGLSFHRRLAAGEIALLRGAGHA